MSGKRLVQILSILALILLPCLAYSADYNVDCNDPNATYHSINAVLPFVTAGDYIWVTGTCTENVTFWGTTQLSLIAPTGASLIGNLSIIDSSGFYVSGLNVTAPADNGIYVWNSQHVVLDSCTSNGSAAVGLEATDNSLVYIFTSGSFSNNGGRGISVDGDASVLVYAWGGPVDVSNNIDAGIYAGIGFFSSWGNLTVTGNKVALGSVQTSGFGGDFRAGARGQFGTIFGNNVISGNEIGGVSLTEDSEISFWTNSPDAFNLIENNGTAGIVASFGSQVTFFGGARISGHSDVGVDVYGNSQAYFTGDNKIQGNGIGLNPARAGLRVDGNSEAFIRGGEILQNGGPGVLALANSSVDFANLLLGQNNGGAIVCDSASYMVNDLSVSLANPSTGYSCRVPHSFGPHRTYKMTGPKLPNWRTLKAKHDFYVKLIAEHQKKRQQ